jgi:hypothetical protein
MFADLCQATVDCSEDARKNARRRGIYGSLLSVVRGGGLVLMGSLLLPLNGQTAVADRRGRKARGSDFGQPIGELSHRRLLLMFTRRLSGIDQVSYGFQARSKDVLLIVRFLSIYEAWRALRIALSRAATVGISCSLRVL